jgi:hypothetical protein
MEAELPGGPMLADLSLEFCFFPSLGRNGPASLSRMKDSITLIVKEEAGK